MPKLDLGKVSEAFELFYTVKDGIKRVDEDTRRLQDELMALRKEVSDQKAQIAGLVAHKETIEARVEAIVTARMAELSIRFVEAQAAARQGSEKPLSAIAQPVVEKPMESGSS